MLNKDKAITYSLLTHIRNTGTLVKGPIDIFTPLIKRTLSKMNSKGVFKGKSLLEIKNTAYELYSIDFPIPVLKKILLEISIEINTDETTHFILYEDGAFSLYQYTFTAFEEIIENQTKEIEEIENLFKSFCETSDLNIEDSESIFKFIEKNKFNLSKYISNSVYKNGDDYTAEAQFIEFFKKIPIIYERIKNIYLGSIISGYLEYNTIDAKIDIELLFDTNFIVGLIDLNTPESTHTCRTLLEIAKKQKFTIRILKDTIDETSNLLETKARYFDQSFLQKKVNPEDVYTACERRELNKSDLERIADNLEKTINDFGISIIYNTEKIKREARLTDEYKIFEKLRNSKKSALHDALAILHIRKARNKKIKEFDKVNAWFVNNSASIDGDSIFLRNGFQPESIKADDLLNILWLSNPTINKAIDGDDLAQIGLTSTISMTLNNNLPKSQILRELDDNIHKYAKENISDTDIIRIATRITNKQLKNIEELNELANQDKTLFVKRLEEEANKQKNIEEARIKRLESLFEGMSSRSEELEKSKQEFRDKSKNIDDLVSEKELSRSKISKLESQLLEEQNLSRELKRDDWVRIQLYNWRRRTWIEFGIFLGGFLIALFYILYQSDWNINTAINYFSEVKSNYIISGLISIIVFILTAITIKTLYDKYRNHSNIQNFIQGLKVPKEYERLNH